MWTLAAAGSSHRGWASSTEGFQPWYAQPHRHLITTVTVNHTPRFSRPILASRLRSAIATTGAQVLVHKAKPKFIMSEDVLELPEIKCVCTPAL